MMDMLKCACRSNFIFFGIFLLFIKMGTKMERSKYSDFVKYLINSKKIQKNIKFDMQAHFNIYIILYIHIHILYYINFSYGNKKSGMKNVDPDYL